MWLLWSTLSLDDIGAAGPLGLLTENSVASCDCEGWWISRVGKAGE